MTRTFLILAGAGALAAAAPAAAQPYGDYGSGYDNGYGDVVDIQGLRAEIDDAAASGDISARDAASLRSQLRGLVNLQRQYQQDGLNRREREDLQQRALGLRNEIAQAGGYAEDNRDRGYGNGYGRDGNRYGGSYDNRYGGTYHNRGTNGYGSTYGNRNYGNGNYGNGNYGNGNYGNGSYGNGYNGTYRDNRAGTYRNDNYRSDDRYDRDDDAYDRDDDDSGYALRVGERATGGLYAVPDAYRTRFRDGGGVYYRYGSGNVYQIDAATGRVLRIYPIDR